MAFEPQVVYAPSHTYQVMCNFQVIYENISLIIYHLFRLLSNLTIKSTRRILHQIAKLLLELQKWAHCMLALCPLVLPPATCELSHTVVRSDY